MRYTYHHGEFRKGTKYRKKSHHVKKTHTEEEINKQLWREQQRVKKDKSRHGWWYKCLDKTKQSCIKKGRGGHRRWIKQNLIIDNYEVFFNNDIDMFIDPWSWD